MDKIKKTYKNRYYKLTGRKNNQWTSHAPPRSAPEYQPFFIMWLQ
jgi:hypothetical protein